MKKKFFAVLIALGLPLAMFSNNVFAVTGSSNLLYQGIYSSKVTALQKDLKNLGFFNYGATGYFGPHTTQSVIAYQKANKLSVDGVVGPGTEREINADKLLQRANAYIGVPYVWGGASPSGFDCSGFTKYMFNSTGVNLPRTAALQYDAGYAVAKSQLRSGDLVFFSTYKAGPSHVGIYISDNKFIGASSSQGISKADLNNSYYAPRFLGARRVLS